MHLERVKLRRYGIAQPLSRLAPCRAQPPGCLSRLTLDSLALLSQLVRTRIRILERSKTRRCIFAKFENVVYGRAVLAAQPCDKLKPRFETVEHLRAVTHILVEQRIYRLAYILDLYHTAAQTLDKLRAVRHDISETFERRQGRGYPVTRRRRSVAGNERCVHCGDKAREPLERSYSVALALKFLVLAGTQLCRVDITYLIGQHLCKASLLLLVVLKLRKLSVYCSQCRIPFSVIGNKRLVRCVSVEI